MKYFINKNYDKDGGKILGECKTSICYSDHQLIDDPPRDWNMTRVSRLEYYLYTKIEWMWRLLYD